MARILIVDDEAGIRALLSAILRKAGFEVEEASNGTEVLRLHQERPFDLIITDIVMPEKEGLEMIRELCRTDPGIKIIAISGSGKDHADHYLQLAEAFGAAQVLAKPFSGQDLLAAVHRVLGE